MARFTKPLLPAGFYVTRNGKTLDATPERLQGYADKFRRMKRQGIRTPLSWGHTSVAQPVCEDEADNAEYWRSALCAGTVEDMEYRPSDRTLYFTGNAPGAEVDADGNLLAWVKLADGSQVRSAVKDVSIGIRDWRSGTGEMWKDAPVHVALCVLPVAHGTDGFKALSTAPSPLTPLPSPPRGEGKPACHCPPGQHAVCGSGGCECKPIPAEALSLSTPADGLYLSAFYFAAERAPKGGVEIQGRHYRGGQWIPSGVIANATPTEKAKLAGAKTEEREALKGAVGKDGPDIAKLRSKVGAIANPHREDLRLTEYKLNDRQMDQARQLWDGWKGHYGDLAQHRLHQAIHADEEALKTADTPARIRLTLRMKAYEHMLDWAEEDNAAKASEQQKQQWYKESGAARVPMDQLHVDPERFQYKLNTGKGGVVKEGSAVEGVKRFRESFAGAVLVWKDPENGRTFIINGHHRYDLAKRAGKKDMNVLYIPPDEARDAKEARKIGALANIAEGRGTATDAAKLIRDEKFTPEDFEKEGVSLKGAQARDAFVLAKLSDSLFKQLVQGKIEPKAALAIGGIDSQESQEQFARFLAKQKEAGKEIPENVLRRMAAKVQNTPSVKTTEETLFGTDEKEENLFLHRAALETHILGKLSQEANLFGAVSTAKKAETLKRGENVISAEKNKEIADEARANREALGKLVDLKGPVADAFSAAAQELHNAPRKRKDIEARLLEQVRGLVRQHHEEFQKLAAAAKREEAPGAATAVRDEPGASGAGRGGTGEPGVKPVDKPGELTEPQKTSKKSIGQPAPMPSAAQRTKPKEAAKSAKEPPIPAGHVRFYHGGGFDPKSGGSRWVSPQREYAEGYARKSGEAGKVHYIDIPKNHPELANNKAWEDEPGMVKAPYTNFEASEALAKGFKPIHSEAKSKRKSKPKPTQAPSPNEQQRRVGQANEIEDLKKAQRATQLATRLISVSDGRPVVRRLFSLSAFE